MTMRSSLKATVKSTWTPLSKEEANVAMFSERQNLVVKWFEKWTNEQRLTVLRQLLTKCTDNQLTEVHQFTSARAPLPKADFSVILPRRLSILILSYLDPRSLCRAAQACSRWKWLAESDEIWINKCFRLGWFPTDTDRHFELSQCAARGVYKQVYVDHLRVLQVEGPSKQQQIANELEAKRIAKEKYLKKLKKKEEEMKKSRTSAPAWRGPSRKPTDTVRMNYLDDGDLKDTEERRRRVVDKRQRPNSASNNKQQQHVSNIRQIHQQIQKLSTSTSSTTLPSNVKSTVNGGEVSSVEVRDSSGDARRPLYPTVAAPISAAAPTDRSLPFESNPWILPADNED